MAAESDRDADQDRDAVSWVLEYSPPSSWQWHVSAFVFNEFTRTFGLFFFFILVNFVLPGGVEESQPTITKRGC